MLKQVLLIGAAAISFPALAQSTDPASPETAPPTQTEPADPTTPADPTPDATTPADPAGDPATPPAGEAAQSAPQGAAASPAQIAQIVEQEFPTYDADSSSELNEAEFGAWMKKLRTATDPSVDPESEQVKSWVSQAWGAADADKSGGVTKEELTAFLSRGA